MGVLNVINSPRLSLSAKSEYQLWRWLLTLFCLHLDFHMLTVAMDRKLATKDGFMFKKYCEILFSWWDAFLKVFVNLQLL